MLSQKIYTHFFFFFADAISHDFAIRRNYHLVWQHHSIPSSYLHEIIERAQKVCLSILQLYIIKSEIAHQEKLNVGCPCIVYKNNVFAQEANE